jgi:serine/threonine protein kinase
MNSRNIYHRDLKPENFLILRDKNGLIYLHLNDFGTVKSSIIDEKRIRTNTGTTVGTIEYMAPEILSNKGHGKASDFWSLVIYFN